MLAFVVSALERTLLACLVVVPGCRLSSAGVKHDIVLNDVKKCTYLVSLTLATTLLEHRKTSSMWLKGCAVPCSSAHGCLPAPRQKPCPCGASVGRYP